MAVAELWLYQCGCISVAVVLQKGQHGHDEDLARYVRRLIHLGRVRVCLRESVVGSCGCSRAVAVSVWLVSFRKDNMDMMKTWLGTSGGPGSSQMFF